MRREGALQVTRAPACTPLLHLVLPCYCQRFVKSPMGKCRDSDAPSLLLALLYFGRDLGLRSQSQVYGLGTATQVTSTPGATDTRGMTF